MVKIIISGCNGHMGRVVAELCQADPQVEVVAGFDVLGPADREFPVFCSAKEAHASLVARVSQGLLPRGDWQIFRLKGGYKELGTARGPGNYVLRTPARLAEWCPEQSYR